MRLPLLLALPILGAACASEIPYLASRPARPVARKGAGEVLVLRSADPVSVLPPGEEAPLPLAYYNKSFRAPGGSVVIVGPGGRAEVVFPDGSVIAASGSCVLEVLGQGTDGGSLCRVDKAERLEVELRGKASALLPGGAIAAGDGASFVAETLQERILRVESRGDVPLRLQLEGEEVLLDAARSVDLPVRGVPGAGRS